MASLVSLLYNRLSFCISKKKGNLQLLAPLTAAYEDLYACKKIMT